MNTQEKIKYGITLDYAEWLEHEMFNNREQG